VSTSAEVRSSSRSIALLETLTQADAVPGHEDEVRRIFRSRLAAMGELGEDRLGSVFCTKPGAAETPRILLESHMDEVGFVVHRITPAGLVKFLPLGGWWAHVLPAQRVRILTPRGKVQGVIGARPPHVLKPAEREKVQDMSELFIDVGAASQEEAAAFGIAPGQPVVPLSPFQALSNPNVLSSKAFDNRVGVALVIETLEELSDHPNTVIGAGSVQEEVGMRGAGTMTRLVEPDLAIVIEGPYADDAPATDRSAVQSRLGGGVHVRLYDSTMIPNPRLCEFVIQTARSHGIPHQPAVWAAGGTDAAAIHQARRGVPTIVLGVPVRYIHSHVSLVHLDDYLAAKELLLHLLRSLDRPAADAIAGAGSAR
jgi:putative aminopeptidase FrvX